LDGKHIVVQKPRKSGSTFYTYKHTFALQLLALINADYQFLYVDVGCQGRIGDAGVYYHSGLSKALINNTINIPAAKKLPQSEVVCRYMLVADEAFPLTPYMMKPYAKRGLNSSEKVFNYRLSRARRVIENSFGILAHWFRVFLAPICLSTKSVTALVLAAVTLHNFLRSRSASREVYCSDAAVDRKNTTTGEVISGEWRLANVSRGMVDMMPLRGNLRSDGKEMRDKLAEYFVADGAVPWQWVHG